MIIVTGATGHLGNVLVRELVNASEKVRVLILPGESLDSLSGLPVQVSEGDVR
jgi:dihydroflavonol-4-reductase